MPAIVHNRVREHYCRSQLLPPPYLPTTTLTTTTTLIPLHNHHLPHHHIHPTPRPLSPRARSRRPPSLTPSCSSQRPRCVTTSCPHAHTHTSSTHALTPSPHVPTPSTHALTPSLHVPTPSPNAPKSSPHVVPRTDSLSHCTHCHMPACPHPLGVSGYVYKSKSCKRKYSARINNCAGCVRGWGRG